MHWKNGWSSGSHRTTNTPKMDVPAKILPLNGCSAAFKYLPQPAAKPYYLLSDSHSMVTMQVLRVKSPPSSVPGYTFVELYCIYIQPRMNILSAIISSSVIYNVNIWQLLSDLFALLYEIKYKLYLQPGDVFSNKSLFDTVLNSQCYDFVRKRLLITKHYDVPVNYFYANLKVIQNLATAIPHIKLETPVLVRTLNLSNLSLS